VALENAAMSSVLIEDEFGVRKATRQFDRVAADLTGAESADLEHYARVFSEALGRPIRYRDVPLPTRSEGLRQARFPEHVVRHLSAMVELTRQGRFDRMTDTMYKLTGKAPMNMRDFVKLHAAEFKEKDDVYLSKNA